jgi:hypothetical protein
VYRLEIVVDDASFIKAGDGKGIGYRDRCLPSDTPLYSVVGALEV